MGWSSDYYAAKDQEVTETEPTLAEVIIANAYGIGESDE